ncbi:DnaJ domain-containing protein [Dioscorea alata]|uniref:DnaJ domain-containing protein n=2 Tax=Dioscorea alata TaxID=55571 RepID=A0ACB7UJH9_DIOAL|nr:DnaJ domain-containing protein [Dioscorea alata]KAH7660623.1 DnaJ domain-containing protein [Dioscorea alata]
MSRGQSSQPRPRPRPRGLERCQNKGSSDNGEVIDVEKIDVVVIDDTETSYYRTRGKNKIPSVVISIDDEEEVDAERNPGGVGCSAAVEGSDSDGDCVVFVKEETVPLNSRMKNVIFPECGSSRNHFGLYTPSEDGSSENGSSEIELSESESSDAESSDCEIMDGSSGGIRELWEKASLRKKFAEMNRYEPEDRVSASGSNTDPESLSPETTQDKAEVQDCFNESHSKNSEQVPVQCRESCSGREGPCPGKDTGTKLSEDAHAARGKDSVVDSYPDAGMHCDDPIYNHMDEQVSEKRANLPGENAFNYKEDATEDVEIPQRTPACDDKLQTDVRAGNDQFTFPDKGEQIPVENAFYPSELPNEYISQDRNGPCPGNSSSPDPQPRNMKDFFSGVTGPENKGKVTPEPSLNSKDQRRADVDYGTYPQETNDFFPGKRSLHDPQPSSTNEDFSEVTGFGGKNKASKPFSNPQTQQADVNDEPVSLESDTACEKISSFDPQPFCKNEVFPEFVAFKGEEKAVPPSCYPEAQHANVNYDPNVDSGKPCAEKISVFHPRPCYVNQVFSEVAGFDDDEQLAVKPSCNSGAQHANVSCEDILQEKAYSTHEELSAKKSLDCSSQAENTKVGCIVAKESEAENELIGDREKHKESDEYKRAQEEEWASRQRELQLQSEEAQRMRKKRRTEALRLIDMERRQKQRLEEMRESQKKVEETINLKEQYRAEVRKELEQMETRYRDLASLLRGLGIHVRGGQFPLPHEVHSAYKQALLRYHPDRASRTDLRGQVEAEETFKLISRCKEKLLPISY